MVIRILPSEIKSMTRTLLFKLTILIAVTFFVASASAYLAVVALRIGQYGYSALAMVISIAVFFIGILPTVRKITDHEVFILKTPGQLEFARDIEAVESELMTGDEFMKKHAVEVMRIVKVLQNYTDKHIVETMPEYSQVHR